MRRFTKWFLFVFLSAFAVLLAVPFLMRFSSWRVMYADPERTPKKQVAIVLGASVVRGEPSPALAARAERAAELYLNGKVGTILVSGDSGTMAHDEVGPVREYLEGAGVAGEDIFLDHAGFDTYSSMYRARAIFGITNAIIVTQSFHMPRALFIARQLGINASGVVAKEGDDVVYAYAREIPASWKALIDTLTNRKPQELGAPVSLEGDGRTTW